uniref:SUMO-specific isopeptidase USPL1 n=1 Tax=Jaculus jaculus TaxID=51337 RepID=UPI001E1B47DC|nr:SUMO-specific isopeptidase USPL1 [Jaculus jaculus]
MMDSLKSGNGLPVIGPGPGIGRASLPMLGYLGKSYDSAKAAPDGLCPACKEKGQLKALKPYRISFQESVLLCEDLQCIYPLGFKSLNNLISPDLEDCHTAKKPQKRKILENSCKDVPLLANSKKPRNHIATEGEQIWNRRHGEVHDEGSSDVPGSSAHSDPVRTACFLEQNETLDTGNVDVTAEEDPAPAAAAAPAPGPGETRPLTERSMVEAPSESGRLPLCQALCVQWKNTQSLCWLDCILSALVHLEGLRNTVTSLCSEEKCIFWRLFGKYNEANKLLYSNHLDSIKGGHCKRTTSEIFAEIEACLNEVRDEVFTKLQPQLRCTLGEMESPVFAFPLLLKIEPHIEKLFTYSFSWDFKCSQCGYQYQNRCMKSLVTFTNVIPEWHPLNAAHFGPCNSCNNKSQIRKMVLEIVPPVFMLHFVEGLPQSDLQRYAFHWEDSLYQVTSVIQYQARSHFITWILDADGSWLECDDLKGPCAARHRKCDVPASEIHIVIWERRLLHVTDEEAASVPLTKPNDRDAAGKKRPASPAPAAPCTHLPPASPTLPQDGAGHHGLPDSIVPSTLETSREAVSVIQMDFKDPPAEDRPWAETSGLLGATASSLSGPRGDPPARAPPVGSAAGDTDVPTSVSRAPAARAARPVRAEASAETEDTPLPFLPVATGRLKPEQRAPSRGSEPGRETSAPAKESPKRPFVGSWVQGLLRKGAAFMPPCVSAHARSSLVELQPAAKGATNFDGFKIKGARRKSSRTPRRTCRCVAEEPGAGSGAPAAGGPGAAPPAPGSAALEPRGAEASPPLAAAARRREHGVASASPGGMAEDQIHKLRLKLLKKLKAKKKKLASLQSSPQTVTPPSENLESLSHCGSPSDGESIEDLLKELQYQIDAADNKARCTTAPPVSSHPSQSQEDILAELLSPTTISTELSESVEPDFRYLEMGDSNSPAPAPSELSTHLKQDHNYCSPVKKTQCEVESDSLANSACIRALDLESPMKTDIFDEFFSTSSLTTLANDTLDLPHFDEYLFENC